VLTSSLASPGPARITDLVAERLAEMQDALPVAAVLAENDLSLDPPIGRELESMTAFFTRRRSC
jgi:hypothetical protein